jgi:hypothetical protein
VNDRARLTTVVGVLVLSTTVGIAAAGGGGVVSATGGIGALHVDVSSARDVRRAAGAPAFSGRGRTSAPYSSFLRWYDALGYTCSRRGPGLDPGGARATRLRCRTVYFVNPRTGRLAGFWTDSPAFRTSRGSRPGLRQDVADRLEGAHAYVHALTGIDRSTPTASLLIENAGCKPGANPNTSPCLGGVVKALILEGRHPVGLLEDGIPFPTR